VQAIRQPASPPQVCFPLIYVCWMHINLAAFSLPSPPANAAACSPALPLSLLPSLSSSPQLLPLTLPPLLCSPPLPPMPWFPPPHAVRATVAACLHPARPKEQRQKAAVGLRFWAVLRQIPRPRQPMVRRLGRPGFSLPGHLGDTLKNHYFHLIRRLV
jgi:hypothetical protein